LEDQQLLSEESLLARLGDSKLLKTLLPFQRVGVRFGLHENVDGRVLIADEMGLGKTLQSLCVAEYYRSEVMRAYIEL
jgi:SNF2 family DNA or RNA helicase